MKKNISSGFTLIEVIVAASILSVTVFGVYKLIGENTKLIGNSREHSQVISLFQPLKECIKESGVTGFGAYSPGDVIHFNFGSNLLSCGIGTSPAVTIDAIEYSLTGEVITKHIDQIKWQLSIESSGVSKKSIDFVLQ